MQALRRLDKAARAAAIEDVAVPEPGPGDVRLRVSYCGVCGSDLHSYLNHAGYESVLAQVTFGHELSGTVDALGNEVTGWKIGQKATMVAIQGCLESDCAFCMSGGTQFCPDRRVQGLHLDGGMAEFVCVDQRHLIPIPAEMPMQTAALTEPLSVAVHCVENCSPIQAGDRLVVTGPGIIGMLCAIVARHSGARVVISGTANDEAIRLTAARAIGLPTLTVGSGQPSLAEQVRDVFDRDADVLIEASGGPAALDSAAEAIRPCGTLSIVAIYGLNCNLNITSWVRRQLTVRASYGSALPSYYRAIELLSAGKIPVDELVKVYPLADGIRAFTDAENQAVMKPLLDCGGDA